MMITIFVVENMMMIEILGEQEKLLLDDETFEMQ
jgi:hypothetical protein